MKKITPIAFHKKLGGKLETKSKVTIDTKEKLSLAYTPGVAEVSMAIYNQPSLAKELTIKKDTVAIITDGTAVLGLGDIGPLAGLPVMEGKAAILKEFSGLNSFPICIAEKNPDELIKIIKAISVQFAAINLEDISAPRCFAIEEALQKTLDIPVMHDDQHGTATVVLAATINSLKLAKKNKNVKVVINGAGAAGTAIAVLLSVIAKG